MTNKITGYINTILDVVLNTESYEGFVNALDEELVEVSEALQFFGDASKEDMIEVSLLTLYKVCPEDKEEHVLGCLGALQGIIQEAWENFDENVLMAVKAVVGDSSDEVAHLEQCLTLDTESSGTQKL